MNTPYIIYCQWGVASELTWIGLIMVRDKGFRSGRMLKSNATPIVGSALRMNDPGHVEEKRVCIPRAMCFICTVWLRLMEEFGSFFGKLGSLCTTPLSGS